MTTNDVREPARLLVVEDDGGLRELLVEELQERGYDVRETENARDALIELGREPADLVLCDLRLPGPSGRDLLERLKSEALSPAFILITAFGTVSQAVEALKEGADDFLTKPLDLEHLAISIERALQTRRLREEVSRARDAEGRDDSAVYHGMYGGSPVMQRFFAQIPPVAQSGGAVLITGESGTGKELVARAVHAESDRREGPFVAVNCAGVPEQLLESEFFGHTAGAFTGAAGTRQGLFAAAEGGTLFLDEISEMPGELQAKLLRVLQEGRIRPVGSDRERDFDVRVVAATNRDVRKALEEGAFREDLYYRLETFGLHIPPLRERGEDMELLAVRFAKRFAARMGRAAPVLTEGALACLRDYDFPGNVRELENVLERAVAFAAEGEIRPEHLPERLRRFRGGDAFLPTEASDGDRLPTLAEIERQYIRHVLARVDGNKLRAAEWLGIGRRTLYRKLKGDEE